MIRTTFRIIVETGELDDDLITPQVLSRVFKCAPTRHAIIKNYGLPSESVEPEEPTNALGKLITAQAIRTHDETFAMRKTFGIPNTERTNIDTEHGKLPRILSEPLFERPKEAANTTIPKTREASMYEAIRSLPQALPTLALRVSILRRPIWEQDDPVARQNWKKVIRPQTKTRVQDLQNDLLRLEAPNNLSSEVKQALQFERLELRFDTCVLTVANTDTNRFGDVEEALDTFYELLNSDLLDIDDVARVDAPFIDFDVLTEELEALKEAAEAPTETGESEEDSVDTDDSADNAESSDIGDSEDLDEADKEDEKEPPSRTQGVEALHLADESNDAAQSLTFEFEQAEQTQDDVENEETEPENAEVWGVIFNDGSVRYIDMGTREFCDKPESVPNGEEEQTGDAEVEEAAAEASSEEQTENEFEAEADLVAEGAC
ncbi:MAG: hypothetical protein LUD25_02575 [Coriobacteriaceae bacterium]|nr:hypothetical protein [Coriobacteriaceae bacterium]